ncbi:hypothetical protein FUMI01_20940 [Flavobacterium sp. UMI-01]|nr:hypothetical protein FUMI01_20940 [Flavobacterium sp. UMI-01]
MKQKITLTLSFLIYCSTFIYGQTIVNDFETGSTTPAGVFGASVAVVANPDQTGINTSANCLKIGRTSTNWYEFVRIDVNPDLAISTSDTKFLSVMVYGPKTDIGCRFDATSDTNNGTNVVRPSTLHSGASGWEQIIIPIVDSQTATNFTKTTLYSLIFHADIGVNVPGGRILNNTDSFLYIDEVKILNSNPSLGTNSFELENGISLYPNPAQSSFKLELKNDVSIAHVSLYNITGEKITESLTQLSPNEYDISDLSSGLYIVKIRDSKGALTSRRLIKQ